MNKQELIEHQIVCHNVVIEQSERAIQDLKAQLAEAEKPKLRHGDFGMNMLFPRIVINGAVYNSSGECIRNVDDGAIGKNCAEIWFGNIFDLMKDWGKDLKGFLIRSNRFRIDFENAMYPFKIADGWFTSPEAEEIWHKLGQMIMTLKRNKQGD